MFRSKAFHLVLGLSVSTVLLVWLYFAMDWHEVAGQLGGIHYWVIVPSLAVLGFHFAVRAVRWKYLLPFGPATRFGQRFDAIMVGNFANFVLPSRAGEFIRPYLFSRWTKESFSRCFVSVVMERFFDLAAVLITFAIMVPFLPEVPAWVHHGAQSLSVVALAIFAFIVLATMWPQFVIGFVDGCVAFVPKKIGRPVRDSAQELVAGTVVLRHNANLLKTTFLSVVVWLSAFGQHYVFLYFLDIDPSAWLSVCIVVISALAVAAPSAPGFIGVYQTGCVVAFVLFGMDKEIGMAYSIVTHVFSYLVFVLYGLFVMFKYQLSLTQLRETIEEEPQQTDWTPPR